MQTKSKDIYMLVDDCLNTLLIKSTSAIPQKVRRERLKLYVEGLKSKIRQTKFVLAHLLTLSGQEDDVFSSTEEELQSVLEQVCFYCDAFWIFLYSSLDVLAQIINQALSLRKDERHASFMDIKNELEINFSGSPVQIHVNYCVRSHPFKNLEKYRNCSIHRRHIYIEEEYKKVKRSAGYRTSTTEIKQDKVVRTICDDPYDLIPKTTQKRIIPDYMEQTMGKILMNIVNIVKNIRPQ